MATAKQNPRINKPKIISMEPRHTAIVIHLATKDDCKRRKKLVQ
jgi:hypothetical protein